MNVERTSSYYKLTSDIEQSARFIRLTCIDTIVIVSMYNSKDETIKPFHPLKIEIDGTTTLLSTTLQAGTHIIQFLGEAIEGKVLLLTGANFEAITALEIHNSDPDSNVRSGSTAVIQGINTIPFRRVDAVTYNISCYLMNGDGMKSETSAIPRIPPFTDSRTKTSFDVDCAEAGTLYWNITPHK